MIFGSNQKLLMGAAGVSAPGEPWSLSGAYYSGTSFNVSSQESNPQELFFKPDGAKMYVIGTAADNVNEYDLSTAWDVSSATFLQSFSVASRDGLPTGLFFKPEGDKFYFTGRSNSRVYEFNLSNSWDVSSATFVQNFSVASQEGSPTDVSFRPDGTKMYVVGFGNDNVNEYDLSTAWNISTASFLQSFSVASQEGSPGGLSFKPDGTKMYVVGSVSDMVSEYDLVTAWDVSTASYVQGFDVLPQEANPSGLFFKPDGLQFYIVGTSNDSVFVYNTV
jgi:DNA-binding beta-propeller fold protein YncE